MTQPLFPSSRRTAFVQRLTLLGRQLFWPTFILLISIHCLENTTLNYYKPTWMPAVYLYRNLLYGILLVKIAFLSTYRPKELWWILGSLVLSVLCWRATGDMQMLEWVAVAVAAKDAPRQKLLYALLLTKGIAIALTLFLHEIGILPTLYYLNGNDPIYNTMGFCHRNVLGANMAILCMGWFYLRFRRIGTMDVLLWLTLSAVTFFLAISRTGLIIMLMIIVVMCVLRRLEAPLRRSPRTCWVCVGIYGGLFLLCLVGTVFYQEGVPFWDGVNDLLTKRLSFAHRVLEEFGLTLFGQDLPFVASLAAQNTEATALILDNSYMRAILYFGLLPGLAFLGTFGFCLWRNAKKGHIALLASLLVMAVFGLSESYMLDVFYNFPLLLSVVALFRKPSAQEAVTPVGYALQVLKGLPSQIRRLLDRRRTGGWS